VASERQFPVEYESKVFSCIHWRIEPFKGERSREGRLKKPVECKKWKILVLLYFSLRLNFLRRDKMIW